MFSFLGSGKNRDLAAEEELVRGITPSSTPTSLELWTVSKILGRECATVNKDFFVCKRDMGDKPSHCAAQADLVMNCTHNIVSAVKKEFPEELAGLSKCLDFNDFRLSDCRQAERRLLDAWNLRQGYTAPSPPAAAATSKP